VRVPVIEGWISQWKAYEPAVPGAVRTVEPPPATLPESNEPLSAVRVCVRWPWFWKVTRPPAATVPDVKELSLATIVAPPAEAVVVVVVGAVVVVVGCVVVVVGRVVVVDGGAVVGAVVDGGVVGPGRVDGTVVGEPPLEAPDPATVVVVEPASSPDLASSEVAGAP
jgi:hypothetical protein